MRTSFGKTYGGRAIELAKRRIRAVIAKSPIPEDPGHAENTLQWLLYMSPDANVALRLAALAHDIERARPNRLTRDQFSNYDAFKAQHAVEGAIIADLLLAQTDVNVDVRRCVRHLITHHESGGDPGSDLLKDADSLSYFDHNMPFYYQREGWTGTLRRARWGFQRLSVRAQRYYCSIRHSDPNLQRLLHDAMPTATVTNPKNPHSD